MRFFCIKRIFDKEFRTNEFISKNVENYQEKDGTAAKYQQMDTVSQS